ncbi:hypothetical protein KUU44_31975, partial [Pseudomonas aeruginosa]|nr:hypothetical protein [Pseudomonas aeruginosa]
AVGLFRLSPHQANHGFDPALCRVFFCLTMTPARYFAGLRRSSIQQVYQELTRVHHMPVLSET